MAHAIERGLDASSFMVLFLAIGLSGCTKALVLDRVPDGSQVGGIFLRSSSTTVESQEYSVDEGSIIVSEDPADSNSRKISLPVRRIRSSNPKHGEPIFWLNGGPGISNMEFKPSAALLENHDIVMVGYRGVDGSTVLGSEEISDAFKETGDDLLGKHSRWRISRAIERFSMEMKKRGVDLGRYTIVEVISDFEIAREALGYPRVNLLSASYGTRVALLYAYLHPGSISRSVMVGVNPPGRFVWDPAKIDEQLNYLGRLSSGDSGNGGSSSIERSIRNAFRRMPSHWTMFKLDPGKIKIVTFAMLYQKKTAAMVLDSFRAAERGDYSGLYVLQLGYDFMVPNMLVWGEFLAKGISADLDTTTDYASTLNDTTTALGSPFTGLIWGDAAEHWHWKLLPPELRTVRPSEVQTLLVSGSVDFSTPAEYATKELLPFLPNGRQVVLKEMGHVADLMELQPDAFSNLLVRFYNEGVVDDSRFRYDPMNFEPSVSLPFWAKALYPLVALASLF